MDSRLRDCAAILFCHYEMPLRRRGNPMYSATYEIASVATLPRNDITTQFLRGNDFLSVMPEVFCRASRKKVWVPACAGMTNFWLLCGCANVSLCEIAG